MFAAIIALLAAYWFLGGRLVRARSYPIHAIFRDARKLDKGADVRMAGVRVGLVSGIRLTSDSRARVDMVILNNYPIPEDSLARITTGGLIGDNYIEILPGSRARRLRSGERISSAQLAQFDQLIEQTGDLLRELQTSARALNEILGDEQTVAAMKRAVSSLGEAANSASELLGSARSVVADAAPQIERVLANLDAATTDAVNTGRQIREMIANDARPNLRAVMDEARETVENLNLAVQDAQRLIASFDRGTGELNQALARANAVAAQAEEMMVNLRAASGELRDMASDQEMQENVRRALRNTADASEQARELMTDLNRRFGRPSVRVSPAQRSAIPGYGANVDALWNADRGEYRLDANYTFAGGADAFYRIGCYSLGEGARLNLQLGRTLDSNNSFRYGLYASRLGLGYDMKLGESALLSADLFRPNDPQMEVRAILEMGKSLGLYTGVSDALHRDRRDLMLGLRYHK